MWKGYYDHIYIREIWFNPTLRREGYRWMERKGWRREGYGWKEIKGGLACHDTIVKWFWLLNCFENINVIIISVNYSINDNYL